MAVLTLATAVGACSSPTESHPPSRAVAIGVGDTASGVLEKSGEVDTFTFQPTNGSVLLLYANGGGLHVQAFAPSGQLVGAMTGNPFPAPSVLDQKTNPIAITQTGTYRILVSQGAYGHAPWAYQLFLFQTDLGPETAASALSLGDSVVTERLETPDDIDRFDFTVPGNDTVNFAYWMPYGTIVRFHLMTMDSVGLWYAVEQSGADSLGMWLLGNGDVALPPGTYRLQVTGPTMDHGLPHPTYPIPYKVISYQVHSGTETPSDTIAIGSTVTGAMEPIGDYDVFHFSAGANQWFNIVFQGVPPDSAPRWMTATLNQEPVLGGPFPPLTPGRFGLTRDTSYTLELGPRHDRALAEHGSYQFSLLPLDTLVEATPSRVNVGQTYSSERIDRANDLDRFSVTAPPGTLLEILFQEAPNLSQYQYLYGQWLGDAGDTLVSEQGLNSLNGILGVGLRLVPASGEARFQFYWGAWGDTGPFPFPTAPYRFTVVQINPAPEAVPAAIVVDDTIRGEAIDQIGDVDDFTFVGTAGDTVGISAISDTVLGFGGNVHLLLVAPSAVDTLLDYQVVTPAGWESTPQVVLPAAGTYSLRLSSVEHYGQGGYSFVVHH